jgi:integrase
MHKVTLRDRDISKGRKSLYLDIYPPVKYPATGKESRREFLGLYIYQKPKNPIEKRHNKEQCDLANQIRSQRELKLNKPEIYSGYEREQLRKIELGEKSFVEFFQKLANKRRSSNHDNWVSALNYLKNFAPEGLKFSDLNEQVCEDFKEYLLTTKSRKSEKSKLARNSAVSYFNKFKAALREAHRDKYIDSDLHTRIKGIKSEDVEREFLDVHELENLIKTPCNNPLLKRAAIFSALTGLRFSDIQKLKWKEVTSIEGKGYYIRFAQKKTRNRETLPINLDAFNILTENGAGSGDVQVFEGLKYSAYQNKHLYQWIGAAGITKDITFHCFRHTHAILQLANGTDLWTVQKLLGHRDIKTTQIYARVIDKATREAADKIKLDFGSKDGYS